MGAPKAPPPLHPRLQAGGVKGPRWWGGPSGSPPTTETPGAPAGAPPPPPIPPHPGRGAPDPPPTPVHLAMARSPGFGSKVWNPPLPSGFIRRGGYVAFAAPTRKGLDWGRRRSAPPRGTRSDSTRGGRPVPGGRDVPLRPIGAGSRPFTGRGLRSKPLVAGPLCKRYACLLGRRLKLLRIGAVSSFAYFIPGSSPGCLSPFPHGTVALSISHPLLRLWGRYPVKF